MGPRVVISLLFCFLLVVVVARGQVMMPGHQEMEGMMDHQHQEMHAPGAGPLPHDFVNHGMEAGQVASVDRHQVINMLVNKVKQTGSGDEASQDDVAVMQLKNAAMPLLTQHKVDRLVRAIQKLNFTADEIKEIASEIASAGSEAKADKVRRAIEDAVVAPSSSPFGGGQRPFFPFRGGGVVQQQQQPFFGAPPPPFRFAGPAGNPFFSVPLTSPALEMDLDRLLFLATPTLGIEKAFHLTKLLHDQGVPRSEVFQIQESFQKNMTIADAEDLIKKYESKQSESTDSPTPTSILQSTAQLSGLNATESKRFARAIQNLGSLNSTQAAQIHSTIQDHALNKTELITLTKDIEKLSPSKPTITPAEAEGADWVFSSNSSSTSSKRNIISPSVKMFSANRACGFTVVSDHHGVVYPWATTVICPSGRATAALISSDLVVLPASFILACGSNPVKVILGDNRVGQTVEAAGVAAIIHPHFKSDQTTTYDFGVLKISPPIDFNVNPLIFPICVTGVETDDPTINCEVMIAGQQPPPATSPVRCFHPGSQACQVSSNSVNPPACIQPANCNIGVGSQWSAPVQCRRESRSAVVGSNWQRYYLWGITTNQNQSPASSSCTHNIATASVSFDFYQKVMQM